MPILVSTPFCCGCDLWHETDAVSGWDVVFAVKCAGPGRYDSLYFTPEQMAARQHYHDTIIGLLLAGF